MKLFSLKRLNNLVNLFMIRILPINTLLYYATGLINPLLSNKY